MIDASVLPGASAPDAILKLLQEMLGILFQGSLEPMANSLARSKGTLPVVF